MYRQVEGNSTMGFSLRPPTWATNLVNATVRGTTAVAQAAAKTQGVLSQVANASAQPTGDPALTTSTNLRVGVEPGLPSWVLPAAAIGALFLFMKHER